MTFEFTLDQLEQQYSMALERGYAVIRCKDYTEAKKSPPGKLLVNRVDVDFSVKKARKIAELLNKLDIKGTFFIRLHAPEYNPFSFESYKVIKFIIDSGHEIGHHSEVIDQSVIWNEDPEVCFRKDIAVMNKAFDIEVVGSASHGGMTGLNNLDFWNTRKPSDMGILYEGYDREPEFNLFQEALYVSDSEWTQWKCYDKGILQEGDRRSLGEHLEGDHPLIYLLIHPDTYFNQHFYE